MLNDATGFEKVYLATGRTDLRRGIDGLASIIKYNFKLDPFQKNVLFLFCGRQSTKIKGLVWENDGYLLLYKRLEAGQFQWPRTESECRPITWQEFRWLMEGLQIEQKSAIKPALPASFC